MQPAELRALLLKLKEQLQIYATAFSTLLYIDLEIVNCELEDGLAQFLASSMGHADNPENKDLLDEITRLIGACQQILIERESFESSS